jgi:hypothetical protein
MDHLAYLSDLHRSQPALNSSQWPSKDAARFYKCCSNGLGNGIDEKPSREKSRSLLCLKCRD